MDKYLFTKKSIENKVFTVYEFLSKINDILISENYCIQGEVGEKINKYDNYYFFNLLDKKNPSVLKCFVWKEIINYLGLDLEPGMEIQVFGYPNVRRDKGEFRFQIQKIEFVGEGLLKKQFEKLKRELESEGYFDISIKKKIPNFCENIGLITSRVGRGALKDFITNLGKFGFKIYFYETKVEGSFALEEIISGICWFNKNMPFLDVIVIIRGGGDWENLKPFNSREIVESIVSSRIPIIVGIGHEDDETLADFAADFRASTPTHAAKILTENWEKVLINLNNIEKSFNKYSNIILEKYYIYLENQKIKIEDLLKKLINNLKYSIDYFENNFYFSFQEISKNTYNINKIELNFKDLFYKIHFLIKNELSKIETIFEFLEKNKIRYINSIKKYLDQLEEKINISNPLLKLKQGYSITKNKNGKIIKNIDDIEGEIIETIVYKGRILSKIKEINNVKREV